MSERWADDIRDMMILYKQEIKTKPSIPDEKTIKLRGRLCDEEFNREFMYALGFDPFFDMETSHVVWKRSDRKPDLVSIADGIVDTIVVLIGTALSFGIDISKVWNIIHQSNMAKAVDGKIIYREDKKVLKPEGWTPPDILGCLKERGYEPDGPTNKSN